MSRFRRGDEAMAARRRPGAGDVQELEQRPQEVGRLLVGAHGYLVRGPRDEPIGRIAGFGYDLDDRWPRALIMRPHGLRGLWSPHTWELPCSAVGAVVPARREVRVRGDGRLAAAPFTGTESVRREEVGGWAPPPSEGSHVGASAARSSSGDAR